jgi:hypothetical protein
LFPFVWANIIDIGNNDTAPSQIKGKTMTNPTIPYNETLSVLLVFKFSVEHLCFHQFISTDILSQSGKFSCSRTEFPVLKILVILSKGNILL